MRQDSARYRVLSRPSGLLLCAISALGCVDLLIGGVGFGELHWSQQVTQAVQLPVYVAMLHLTGRALWTGRPEGQPRRRPASAHGRR